MPAGVLEKGGMAVLGWTAVGSVVVAPVDQPQAATAAAASW